MLTLNGVDRDFGHNIETITPEQLSEYIEEVLADAGLDVEALLERRGVDGLPQSRPLALGRLAVTSQPPQDHSAMGPQWIDAG